MIERLTGSMLALLLASSPALGDSAELVVDWNQKVLAMAEAEDGFLTLKGVRTMAMMHLAMHDALSTVDKRYQPYLAGPASERADPHAAVLAAAYCVAVAHYPDQEVALTALRDRWSPRLAADASLAAGRKAGEAAARAVLASRKDDGWDNEAAYQWHPMAPGVYAEFHEHSGTPQGFIFGAGWATAQPFALATHNQFRAAPPPPIDSAAYTQAFNEVKEVGRVDSVTRTADQTHLALWWKDFAENSHNRLARDLVTKENIDLAGATRLFALLNVAIFDAYVNVFDNKFYYNHWRPYTAIRWAAKDGNSATAPDPDWTNTHRHTYAFPSYPSAHGTACAAAMSVIADTFGEDYAFTMRTDEVDIAGPFSGKRAMDPPARSFASPSDAAMECALSRLYLGIHFRYDSDEGFALGNRIGRLVVDSLLTRVAQDNNRTRD